MSRRPGPLTLIACAEIGRGAIAMLGAMVVAVVALVDDGGLGALALFVPGMLAAGAVLHATTGILALRLHPAARALLTIIGVMSLCSVPLGTALGIMLLVYVNRPDVRSLFGSSGEEAQESPGNVAGSSAKPAVLGVMIGIVLGALMIFGSWDAKARLDEASMRGHLLRSMGDLKRIASERDTRSLLPRVAAATTIDDLLGELEGATPQRLPRANGWGHAYRYEAWTDANGRAHYALGSAGRDGRWEHERLASYERGLTEGIDADLIWLDGAWLRESTAAHPPGVARPGDSTR